MIFVFASCDKEVITIDPVINSVDRLIYQSGDTIQITGENFSRHNSNNLIQFQGGIEANSISWSNGTEDTITAIIPQGAQSGDFTLKVYDRSVTYSDIIYIIEGGKFEKLNSTPINFYSSFGFSFNDKLYIGGGTNENGDNNTFWEFDPESDIWIEKAPYPVIHIRDAFSFETDGRIFVGGGYDKSADCVSSFYEYNPIQDNWIEKENIPIENCNCYSLSEESSGYVVCSSSGKTAVYSYNPFEDSWFEMYSGNTVGLGYNSFFRGAHLASNKIYLVFVFDIDYDYNGSRIYLVEFDLETSLLKMLGEQDDNVFDNYRNFINNENYDISGIFFSCGKDGYLLNRYESGRKIWRYKSGDSKLELLTVFKSEAKSGSIIISDDKSTYIIGGGIGGYHNYSKEVWKFTP